MAPSLLHTILLLTCCLAGWWGTVVGQTGVWEGAFHYGRMVRNHPDLPPIPGNAGMAALTRSLQTEGQQPWQVHYRYPQLGVTASFIHPADRARYGIGFGLMPQFTYILRRRDQSQYYLRLATGLAYMTRAYDSRDNPDNLAVGSRLNNMALAEAGFRFPIIGRWWGSLAASVWHLSNAGYTVPNLGMNVPGIKVGIVHQRLPDTSSTTSSTKDYNAGLRLQVRAGMGHYARKVADGPRYPVYTFSLQATKLYNPYGRLSGGVELFYDQGVFSYSAHQSLFPDSRSWVATRIVLLAGHEFIAGRLGLVTQGGIYLRNAYLSGAVFSNRLGLRYYFLQPKSPGSRELFAGIFVKANFGVAAFPEIAAGYIF